jgi:hypothetical protein
MTTLREAAEAALEALLDDPNKLVQISEHHWENKQDLAVIALRAALAERTCKPSLQVELVQEPVAHTLNCVCGAVWDIKVDGSEEMAHTPNTAPAQRKPLTHPQIHELDWPDGVSFEDILLFVRSIESVHGIRSKT